MGANLAITDGVYGILSEIDVGRKINVLAKEINSNDSKNNEKIIPIFREIIISIAGRLMHK